MRNRRRTLLICTLISLLIVGVGLTLSSHTSYTVHAARVDSLPEIDGVRESTWDAAKPVEIPLRGGLTRVREVQIRALHDGNEIGLLLQWDDPTESLNRTPWEFDGSAWHKLPSAEYYEDKAAFCWPITECAEFDAVGCSALCHQGGGQSGGLHQKTGWPGALNVGSHYALKQGELLDEWHWKASRTNPFGQVDDGHLTGDRPTDTHEKGGRFGDESAETGGGYKDNKGEGSTRPAHDFGPGADRSKLWLLASEAEPIKDYSRYVAGDRVPALLLAPLEGKRADIAGVGRWADGKWTLEIRRKLDTGDPNDASFADGRGAYPFGVAIFDGQQFEHSYSVCVQWLELE